MSSASWPIAFEATCVDLVDDLPVRIAACGWRLEVQDDGDPEYGPLLLRGAGLPRDGLLADVVQYADGLRPEGRDLTLDERERAADVRYGLRLAARRGSTPLAQVARVVTALVRLCPELVTVEDVETFRSWSPRWARAIAGGRRLHTHDVVRIDSVLDGQQVWVHTHGLQRFGLPDVDVVAYLDADDEGTFDFLGGLVQGAAEQVLHLGLPPAGEALAICLGSPAAWAPWQEFLVDAAVPEDALGGRVDRTFPHDGDRAVLFAIEDDVPPDPRLVYDPEGWASVPAAVEASAEQARATLDDAMQASAAPARTLWVRSADVGGRVVGRDGDVLLVEIGPDDDIVPLGCDRVERWVVVTPSGFEADQWAAHALPVLDDVEAATAPRWDADGRLLCSGCGTPLGPGHSCPD